MLYSVSVSNFLFKSIHFLEQLKQLIVWNMPSRTVPKNFSYTLRFVKFFRGSNTEVISYFHSTNSLVSETL